MPTFSDDNGGLPVAEINYNRGHDLRRICSTMAQRCLDLLLPDLQQHVEQNCTSNLRILSIGCGDGEFDRALLSVISAHHSVEYLGVDTSREALSGALQRFDAARRQHDSLTVTLLEQDARQLDPSLGPFDVILVAHSLYYFEDHAAELLDIIRTFSGPSSRTFVVLSSADGLPNIVSRVGGLNRIYTAEDLCTALAAAGVSFRCTSITSTIDVTEIGAESPTGNQLLEFLIERDLADLDQPTVDSLRQSIATQSQPVGSIWLLKERFVLVEIDGSSVSPHELAIPKPRSSPSATIRHPEDHDPVSDYRLLAQAFDWETYFADLAQLDHPRLLDVGCGTGRWLSALGHYSQKVGVHQQRIEYCGVDPSIDAIDTIAPSVDQAFSTATLWRASIPTVPLPPQSFDRIWSVHSLYGVDPRHIEAAVDLLVKSLRPGGSISIVLAEPESFYGWAAKRLGGGEPFSTAEDLRQQLIQRGLAFCQRSLVYDERFDAGDRSSIEEFVWQESISNSYPDLAHQSATDSADTDIRLDPWIQTFRTGNEFVFPQNAAVITFPAEGQRHSPNPLAPSEADLRSLISAAGEFVVKEHAGLERRLAHEAPSFVPSWSSDLTQQDSGWADPAIDSTLQEAVPEVGTADLAVLLDEIVGPLARAGTLDNAPGYAAYVPSGGLFHAALAEWIAASLNRYVPTSETAPGLAALEHLAIQWIHQALGTGASAEQSGFTPSGLFVTGGATATLHAVHAARRATEVAHTDSAQTGLVAYYSENAHSCVSQALAVCGIEHQRMLGINEHMQLPLGELESAIQHDLEAGLTPFLVIGTAGDVRTGAVDDLQGLVDVRDRYNLWLHVDAAYGGFFSMCESAQEALRGLDLANSIAVDPHKGMGLPYGTGALLVRDERTLLTAFSAQTSYINPSPEGPGLGPNTLDMGIEYTREFRGLRVWLPLKMLGLQFFRNNLEEMLALCREIAEDLAQLRHVELVGQPTLSICVFRLRAPCGDDENRALLDLINSDGKFFLTGCTMPERLGGNFVIRIALLSFRTDSATVHRLLARIEECVNIVVSRRKTPPGTEHSPHDRSTKP